MSVSIPLQIIRMSGMAQEYSNQLRSLDIEWRCSTHLIHTMLANGLPADVIGNALKDALQSYQQLRRQGANDYIRLRVVLSHIFNALRLSGNLPEPQVLDAWCVKNNVPAPIREYLINV